MHNPDVIVIGAGVAGLAAAQVLAQTGVNVVVLEARNRTGGRVHSLRAAGWPGPVELGAEFVHERTARMDAAARAAGVGLMPVRDEHWALHGTRLRRLSEPWERIDRVLQGIPADFTGSLGAWLDSPSAGAIPDGEREWAARFAEGFHAADLDRLSAAALRGGAGGGDDFRPVGGYSSLLDVLLEQVRDAGVEVRLRAPVTAVRWGEGQVRVVSGAAAQEWAAKAVVVTIPLGVLQVAGTPGAISFEPHVGDRERGWRALGFGHAHRLMLRFRDGWWDEPVLPAALREDGGRAFGYVHAAQPEFPVWWARAPEPVLVGWWGGAVASAGAAWSDQEALDAALRSLSAVVGVPTSDLRSRLVDWKWHNWSADVYTRGAYSYATAGMEEERRALGAPLADTVFFAGEAFASTDALGTVHGAWESGATVGQAVGAVVRHRRLARVPRVK